MIDDELRELERTASRVPFFALVSVLARMFPDAPAVGGLGPPSGEVIRFRHDVRPIFHAADVSALHVVRGAPRARVEITTSFLGIVGSVSPLANYFTEDLLRAESHDDRALRAFYDLFHHRLIALVYRAHLRAAPWAEMRSDGRDRATLRSVRAAGVPAHVGPRVLQPMQWLGLAGVVGRRPRTRDSLAAVTALVLPGIPVRVVDFVARDVPLPAGERAQLGVRYVELGRGARLGRRLLGQSGMVRLVVGPVDRATFDSLAPGGAKHAALRSAVDNVTGGLLEVDLDIAVAPGAEPRARLGAAHGTRLGSTALLARPRSDHPLTVRVSLTAAAEPAALAQERATPAPA